jgi:predicted dehydrogenase/nucleoside-diphosphate-sugar epimerase
MESTATLKSTARRPTTLRVGIAGCGKVADYHARFIKELADVELVGVADVNESAARHFADKHVIGTAKASLVSLLDSVELDVLHVATPPRYHYECAKLALDRGKHVFLEKPMAFTSQEVADLYDRAATAQLMLCPDFIHLFHPRMRQLLTLIESGQLGRVVHVESQCCINLDEETDDLRESLGLHWSYQLPGGLLRDYTCHVLYLALHLSGGPENVQMTRRSSGRLPQGLVDHLAIQIEGANCTANVLVSCMSRPSALRVRVLCEKGTGEVDFGTQTLLVKRQSSLPRMVTTATANFVDSWKLSTSATSNIVNYLRGKVVPYAGLRDLIPRFYDSIRHSTMPPIRRELAAAVTQVEEKVFAGSTPPCVKGCYVPSRQSGVRRPERILVTGASGYVGSALVGALVRDGYYVRALVRPTSSVAYLKQLGVEVFLGDIRRFEDVNAAAEQMDVIVHLAAGLHGSAGFIVDACVQGTQNISKAALSRGTKRVLYMSSMSVYDMAKLRNGQSITEDSPLEEQPEIRGAYSLGKRRAEEIALGHLADSSPSWTILRPSLIVGNGSEVAAPVGWLVGKNLISLGRRRKRLLLIHVEDVATAILQLLQNENTKGHVYTLSHQDAITVEKYFRTCVRRGQRDSLRLICVPYFVARFGSLLAIVAKKLTKRGPTLNRRRLLSMYRDVGAGNDLLYSHTRWRPAGGLLERLVLEEAEQVRNR